MKFMLVKMDEVVDTMEAHLQRVQRLKRRVEEQGEKISENIYNSVLRNPVRKPISENAANIFENPAVFFFPQNFPYLGNLMHSLFRD